MAPATDAADQRAASQAQDQRRLKLDYAFAVARHREALARLEAAKAARSRAVAHEYACREEAAMLAGQVKRLEQRLHA